MRLDLSEEELKEVSEKISSMKSKTSLRILMILKEGDMCLDEIHEVLEDSGQIKYRESAYKALEKMASSGIISKRYDKDRKKIVYGLEDDFLKIEF